MALEKEEEANGDQEEEANGAHLAGVLGVVQFGEFADAVQRSLGGIVEGVNDDDAEALQEPALLVRRLGFERRRLLLLVRRRAMLRWVSFSSWSGADDDSFEWWWARVRAEEARAGGKWEEEDSAGRRSDISPKCQLCMAHFVLYAPRIFDT
jgi:hypothetical protein